MYGVCFTPVVIFHLQQKYSIDSKSAFKISVLLIISTSVVYEWFEWLIAMTLSNHNAEAYNGQQGDMWDAHKDMLLATIGSLLWGLQLPKKTIKKFSEKI